MEAGERAHKPSTGAQKRGAPAAPKADRISEFPVCFPFQPFGFGLPCSNPCPPLLQLHMDLRHSSLLKQSGKPELIVSCPCCPCQRCQGAAIQEAVYHTRPFIPLIAPRGTMKRTTCHRLCETGIGRQRSHSPLQGRVPSPMRRCGEPRPGLEMPKMAGRKAVVLPSAGVTTSPAALPRPARRMHRLPPTSSCPYPAQPLVTNEAGRPCIWRAESRFWGKWKGRVYITVPVAFPPARSSAAGGGMEKQQRSTAEFPSPRQRNIWKIQQCAH